MDDQLTDDMLLQAVRKRIRDELLGGKKSNASIVNNVYGGHPDQAKEGGILSDQMGNQMGGEDPFDYFVDIERRDQVDPEGNKLGWDKKVHRYRKKKVKG